MAKTRDWVVSTSPHVRHNKAGCAKAVAELHGARVEKIVGPEVTAHRRQHGETAASRCRMCWEPHRWNEVN